MWGIIKCPFVLFRSEEQAIFDGVFIAKDEDVTRFINYIQSTTKHVILQTIIIYTGILNLLLESFVRLEHFHQSVCILQISGRGICGGEWSAARETSQRSASKLDEEGLELAVCRHGVLLCALNMYRGEIFAYPLYLQQKLASSRFFCMDVTCKYWPYLQRVTKSCPELQHLLNMKPFLSVFHAKAHDFKCEVSNCYHVTESLYVKTSIPPRQHWLVITCLVFECILNRWNGVGRIRKGLD